MADTTPRFRRPESVLVAVFAADGQALLLRRSQPFEFWQSVTGSLGDGESPDAAAVRELFEETGLTDEGQMHYAGVSRQFAIDARFRHRFGPGVVENIEYEYHYRLAQPVDIRISDDEHSDYRWLPLAEAIDTVWSWTNRDALRNLAHR